MSRKPNVEGIKELRQKLLMFQVLEKEVPQRRSNLETAAELLKFSEKRMIEVGGEVKELLESMDTEVKGNFGWESRLHTLLSEFQRQEREEAKEKIENARIQGENKVRNEEFEKREKAAAEEKALSETVVKNPERLRICECQHHVTNHRRDLGDSSCMAPGCPCKGYHLRYPGETATPPGMRKDLAFNVLGPGSHAANIRNALKCLDENDLASIQEDLWFFGSALKALEEEFHSPQFPAREALARLRCKFGEPVAAPPIDARDTEIKRLETIIANQQQEIDIFNAKAKGEWPNSNSDLVFRTKKAEEALEFYAKPENYIPGGANSNGGNSAVFNDAGKRAADAILSPKPEGWNDKENALKFYANPENWNFSKFPGSLLLTPPAQSDQGAIARIALGIHGREDIKNMLGISGNPPLPGWRWLEVEEMTQDGDYLCDPRTEPVMIVSHFQVNGSHHPIRRKIETAAK